MSRGPGKEIGSGAGDIGKGAAKGAGNLGERHRQGRTGSGDAASDQRGDFGRQRRGVAGKDVAVGTVKGTGKIGKGIGKAVKKLF